MLFATSYQLFMWKGI